MGFFENRALVVMICLIVAFEITCYLTGLALFAYYNGVQKCDPIRALTLNGQRFISNDNQVLVPEVLLDETVGCCTAI